MQKIMTRDTDVLRSNFWRLTGNLDYSIKDREAICLTVDYVSYSQFIKIDVIVC